MPKATENSSPEEREKGWGARGGLREFCCCLGFFSLSSEKMIIITLIIKRRGGGVGGGKGGGDTILPLALLGLLKEKTPAKES